MIKKLRMPLDQSEELFIKFLRFNNFKQALETRFCECSMGMKKLLTLALGLLYPAQIILLDEPFLHLDQENQDFLSELLSSLHASIIVASPENKSLKGFEYKCLS
ncbi:MAG: AAA family ATPase [Bdellovibrionaceae bacterium]|nr:AAA family ATPase [Pseudobdellovibrionaceae bacterium]